MTKHFRDDDGRRWKAWLASRDVFWPDPEVDGDDAEDREAVIFVCFSDPSQTQRRARLPAGSFESMGPEELKSEFVQAQPDPSIR